MVEILSPSTARCDRGKKIKFYKKHPIPEYIWSIESETQGIKIYGFQSGDYDLIEYVMEKGLVKSKILQNLQSEVENIFKT